LRTAPTPALFTGEVSVSGEVYFLKVIVQHDHQRCGQYDGNSRQNPFEICGRVAPFISAIQLPWQGWHTVFLHLRHLLSSTTTCRRWSGCVQFIGN
jgi:hypothetical protein